MRAYKFTGEEPAVFPNIVIANDDGTYRTAELQPGDVFTVDVELEHPLLESAGRATKDMPAANVRSEDVPAVEEDVPAEPATEPAATEESA